MTRVRSPLVTSIHAGFQTAKGTARTNFTAADAWTLWTADDPLDVSPVFREPVGVEQSGGHSDDARFEVVSPARGVIVAAATPASVEFAFRSNWGAYAAGAFSLATQVTATRRATLLFTEGSSPLRTVWTWDAWLHEVRLVVPARRMALLEMSYVSGLISSQSGQGGFTLPSAAPSKAVYPSLLATLVRDPAGSNERLDFESVSVRFLQGPEPSRYDWAAQAFEVWKRGLARVQLEVVSSWTDETWSAALGSLQRYRLTLNPESGTRTFTLDLYGVQLEHQPVGREGRRYKKFVATGYASFVGSNFVTLALAS